MHLQKLEIQGFKSFAEKTVLEFNHDLTAIVGPNGSGKSNVADSVRWVLGEQSLKILRGKKSEDVIFAGTKKRPRLGFAEVNIYLNNEDGQAPIDYQEVVITRRIYRSGESEYLINKNKVRLIDIQLLIAKSNFGQNTYSIIGQGMIDSILTSSPQERKEFFDEATGVRQYQIKKEQAVNKLEHSQVNLNQSQNVLKEIEPRLRSLTRQVRRLERREEIAKQLNELQLKYYSRLLDDLNLEDEKIKQKMQKKEEAQQRLEAVIIEQQKKLESHQVQATAADAFGKLQDDYVHLFQQKNQWLQELTLVKGKLDLELVKLGKVDLVWLQKKQTEINNQLSKLATQQEENTKIMEKLNEQLANKIKEQEQVLEQYQRLQEQLQQAQQLLTKSDQLSLSKIQSHLTSLYQKQIEFLDSLEKIKDLKDLPKLKRRAAEVSQEIKWLLNKLESEQKIDGQDLVKIQEKINQFLTTKDSLVNEIHELKVKVEVAKQQQHKFLEQEQQLLEEKKKIESEINLHNHNGSQQAVQSQLTKQQEESEKKINELDKKLDELDKQLNNFAKEQEADKKELFSVQHSLRDAQIELNAHNNEYNELKVFRAKIETKKEDLEKEIATEVAGNFKPQTENLQINLGETFAEISRLKNQLAIIGGIDEEVVKEYQEVKSRYDFLNEQVTDLEKAIISCHNIIEELEEKIKQQFEEAFEKINDKFAHYFKILFNGGTARLILQKKEMVEETDRLEEDLSSDNQASPENNEDLPKKQKYEFGIEIQATPPGKRLKSLNMLSGGEKALTSIALISAIISNNPSPFVILDEVDAALDEANSERFVKIIDELSDKTQFICITHNRATMQQAAILYGVTMGDDGVSKLLSINLQEAEKVAE